mgnify:CR=1 FL=1
MVFGKAFLEELVENLIRLSYKHQLNSRYNNPQKYTRKENAVWAMRHQNSLSKISILPFEREFIKANCGTLPNEKLEGVACSICLCEFDGAYWALGCTHMFHFDCLMDWFERKPCCPTCKVSFRMTLLTHLADRDQ